jgi:hypothetical protein
LIQQAPRRTTMMAKRAKRVRGRRRRRAIGPYMAFTRGGFLELDEHPLPGLREDIEAAAALQRVGYEASECHEHSPTPDGPTDLTLVVYAHRAPAETLWPFVVTGWPRAVGARTWAVVDSVATLRELVTGLHAAVGGVVDGPETIDLPVTLAGRPVRVVIQTHHAPVAEPHHSAGWHWQVFDAETGAALTLTAAEHEEIARSVAAALDDPDDDEEDEDDERRPK